MNESQPSDIEKQIAPVLAQVARNLTYILESMRDARVAGGSGSKVIINVMPGAKKIEVEMPLKQMILLE